MASLITQNINQIEKQKSLSLLEDGHILFFPDYYHSFSDSQLLSPAILHGTHKNVSYDYKKDKLGPYNKKILPDLEEKLKKLMNGYAVFAQQLINSTLPSYIPHLQWGRTSFRPAQIEGRATSKRKDDTRLHVDAFAATPVNGLRILRVFSNVNPFNEPRVWNVGEPFTEVLERFVPKIPTYSKFKAILLKNIRATKTLRSAYDHYMLHLHDAMKLDEDYQASVKKKRIDFPAKSSWIVFTDHVSHAALSGQYLLEQTFYLSVDKMNDPQLSPLNEWKKVKSDLMLNSF